MWVILRGQMDKNDLINFEKDIANEYENAKIHSPVHLSGGNEEQLIEIFKDIKKEDWVFSTHRCHYHALLKSNNPEWLKKEIMENRSMHINSRKYKIFTSSIVGGIIPIALGTALAIKRKKKKERVWCFVGDMASEMGIFHECLKYARNFKLPITFIIEDNGIGCYTPTKKVWGGKTEYVDTIEKGNLNGHYFKRKYPHHGVGKFINF